MSAETIARWNAIPLERPNAEASGSNSMKRSRNDDDDDESEDDVSLVSRSPSPVSPQAMAIDQYDEYVRGYEREVITVETRIKPSNKGFAMLAKLGWVEGQPLGLSGDGRVDPVPFAVKNDLTGLGKTNQDVRMIETTVSQRRGLDSERQTKETEEQRRNREDTVAKRAAVQSEIIHVLRPFYCELCDKQFKNVAQYDEHTNSYAHHHKARFRDMQAAQKIALGSKEEVDKRKEKERKREEKELRKIAKAAGVRVAKPTTSSLVTPEPGADPTPLNKKSGWATVSPSPSVSDSSVPKQSGWASANPNTSMGRSSVGSSQLGPRPPPGVATPSAHPHVGPPPAFRAGGWASLETAGTSSQPQSRPTPPLPPTPIAAPSRGGSGWSSISQPTGPPSISPVPQANPVPSGVPLGSPPSIPNERQKSKAARAEKQESSRSGWQQFRAGGSRRR